YPDPMPALLSLDLGTTSAKAALIDLEGRSLATASADYPLHHTPDGGCEQEPADSVRAARNAIVHVLPPAMDVAALRLTGQMQDPVPESARGPVRRAVPYTDLRAPAHAAESRTLLAADAH